MDRTVQVGQTAWLPEIHAQHGMPNAVVGHVWFTDPDCAEKLARHAAFPLMRGIRSNRVTASRPGDSVRGQSGTMEDPRWLAGFALLERHALSWDLRVPFWHLADAAEVARAFPRTPIVLNHTGFPWDRSEAGLAAWRRAMEVLGRAPNVHVKVSAFGLKDRAREYESNRRGVLDALAIFGVERAIFPTHF